MDLLTVILACSFASIDDQLLQRIAMHESQARPYYVRAHVRKEGRDNGWGDGIGYGDRERAMAAIGRLVERSDGAYVGLMGVPVRVAADYDMPPEKLLEPCHNVRIASAMLADFQADCHAEKHPDVTGCTLIRYGTATGFHGPSFAEAVLFDALTMPTSAPAARVAETLSDEILFAKEPGNDGSDDLFFELDLGDVSAHSQTKIADALTDDADGT